MDDTTSFDDHKLCGFLCAVLAVNPPLCNLPVKTPCQIFSGGFRSENGVVLSPISSNGDVSSAVGSSSKRRLRRRKRIGLVNGSMSVVHQLQSLVNQKCLKIEARVMRVEIGENGAARATVLVDIYLPIAAWSGWQFPKSGAIAGSLFRHVRYTIHVYYSVKSKQFKIFYAVQFKTVKKKKNSEVMEFNHTQKLVTHYLE